MSWLVYTALSILSRSIYGVMTKVLSSQVKTSAYTQALLLPLAGAFVALILAPFFGGLHMTLNGVNLLTVLLVMLSQGFGNIVYFAAIKHLTSGTAQIAFSSVLVFNTFLALLFLNLQLSLINVFGLVLLMLAILLAVTGKIELNRRGIVLMIFAAFLFSIFQLGSASLSKQVGVIEYLLIAYLGAVAVVFLFKWKIVTKDLRHAELRSTVAIPLLTVIPGVGNFMFAYYAYRDAPEPAKVAMLLTAQVVVAVLLGYIFLRERSHVIRKITAAVLVVLAAILIKTT